MGGERQWKRVIFEDLMVENVSELMKDMNPQIVDSQAR